MPTKHVRLSYSFAELEKSAQEKALAEIGMKLTGDWWDSGDNDSVSADIVYTFATTLGTPGVDLYGEGDFPGIDGVKLEEWSCSYAQGDSVSFAGTLTRENAPSLPWADGVNRITLESAQWGSRVWFVIDDGAVVDQTYTESLRDAVNAASDKAHKAGYAAIEYIGSPENAREYIEGTDPQFNLDGSLFNF